MDVQVSLNGGLLENPLLSVQNDLRVLADVDHQSESVLRILELGAFGNEVLRIELEETVSRSDLSEKVHQTGSVFLVLDFEFGQ